ncbi:putative signal transducing protein [Algibacter sp. Ld11]|uniref:putative signal transducing protein n=1 Tax=Algibacter sp. Ld11 TaxID=649150 RepID=UPI0038674321
MTNSNYIKVFSGDFIVVKRIISDLENEDITAVVKDETESGRLAGFGPSVYGLQEIFVHKDELQRATSIIENTNLEIEP